jgi:hypothetical protein
VPADCAAYVGYACCQRKVTMLAEAGRDYLRPIARAIRPGVEIGGEKHA